MNTRINTRYAKALFEVASERNELEKVFSDARYLLLTLTLNRDFRLFLDSPIVKRNHKKNILQKLFEDEFSTTTLSFLLLLIKKNREINLSGIIRAYIKLVKDLKNIKTAKLTTAFEATEKDKQKFINILSNRFNVAQDKIELLYSENPEIIGGYMLQIDDYLIDKRVSSRLLKIRNMLINKDFKKAL